MTSTVIVSILGKEYQVACPEEEADSLRQSAQLLNERMEKIRHSGKVIGLDRIAVMAALNIAHELIDIQVQSASSDPDISEQLNHISSKVDVFLQEESQLEL